MDKFVLSVGLAHELEHAFNRNCWTAEEVKLLTKGDQLGRVLEALRKGDVSRAQFSDGTQTLLRTLPGYQEIMPEDQRALEKANVFTVEDLQPMNHVQFTTLLDQFNRRFHSYHRLWVRLQELLIVNGFKKAENNL